MAKPRAVVIGLGNPDRGDDGAGHFAVHVLRDLVSKEIAIREMRGSATEVVDAMRGLDHVVLVDAACSGQPAGTIHRLDCADSDIIPSKPGVSSHGFGVAEAIGLARALKCLPSRCIVYAIEGADFLPGEALSASVMGAAVNVARSIAVELEPRRYPAPMAWLPQMMGGQ